jgi:hypothetical protein
MWTNCTGSMITRVQISPEPQLESFSFLMLANPCRCMPPIDRNAVLNQRASNLSPTSEKLGGLQNPNSRTPRSSMKSHSLRTYLDEMCPNVTPAHSSFPVWVFVLVGPREGQSKKWDMPVCVPSARYSLVKGERIVRSVLSTRLDTFLPRRASHLYKRWVVAASIRYGIYRS